MDEYKSILSHLPEKKPPQRLLHTILERISTLEDRRARRQFMVGMLGVVFSSLGLWYGALYALIELKASGLYQYTSVLISDGDAFGVFWKEFLLAASESFPIVSSIIILSMLFILLNSLRSAIRGTREGARLFFTHF